MSLAFSSFALRIFMVRLALFSATQLSEMLHLPFGTLVRRDPYDMLAFLLMHGKSMFRLAKNYIQSNELDQRR